MKRFLFSLLFLISAFAVRSEERNDQAFRDEDYIEDEGYENMNGYDDEEEEFDDPEDTSDNGVPEEEFDFEDDKKETSNRFPEKPDSQMEKPDFEEPTTSPPEEEEGSGAEPLQERAYLRDALERKLGLNGEPDEFHMK